MSGSRAVVTHRRWTLEPDREPDAEPVTYAMQCVVCRERSAACVEWSGPQTWTLEHSGRNPTHLIDLALAHGGPVPERQDFPFRGCLVHYEAPEISRSVLETGTATPTQAADVYALGASLFISATGRRHVDYPDDAPRAEQRQAIVDQRHRPISVIGSLGALFEQMMSRDPADRSTAADVCRELREVRSGRCP